MGLLHASILNVLSNVELTALCDKSVVLRRFLKKVFKKIRIVDDLEKLSDLGLDAVYVTTPISSYFPVVETVYLKDIACNLFVEKTLAAGYDEAEKLCELARGFGGVNMVGYMRRFAVTFKKAKDLLDREVIGDLVSFQAYAYSSDFSENMKLAKKDDLLAKLHLEPRQYFVATIHRQENVDEKRRFSRIIKGLKRISDEFNIPIIYPIHPRSTKRMKEYSLHSNGIKIIDPTNFSDFLELEYNARLVLTDSGGVQEETCILKVPCVTLRDNTERPETLDVGSNILAGTNPQKMVECVKIMLKKDNNWENPFGDGEAGKKTIDILMNRVQKNE